LLYLVYVANESYVLGHLSQVLKIRVRKRVAKKVKCTQTDIALSQPLLLTMHPGGDTMQIFL